MESENIYILDKVISMEELFWIYHSLLDTNGWNLTRSSKFKGVGFKAFGSFPGLNIETKGKSNNQFLSGYFHGLVFRIKNRLKTESNIVLPELIRRVHVGAKSSLSKTQAHRDSTNPKDWTIVGFLNPIWNNEDGGEISINNTKINYKPGRFIVFPSNLKHDGGFIKNENLNYWRITLNVILTEEY